MQREKWLSEVVLQVAEKRRKAKGKGEKINQSECRIPKNGNER